MGLRRYVWPSIEQYIGGETSAYRKQIHIMNFKTFIAFNPYSI